MTMEAPITGESKTERSRTKKHGQVQTGKRKKPRSCEITQPVGTVAINLLFPIIQTSKSTANPNTSTLTAQFPSATLVTVGFTMDDTHVLDAQRLDQSFPIRYAIIALTKVINRELQKDTILGTKPKISTSERSTENIILKKWL
jgi:hypothetical protein